MIRKLRQKLSIFIHKNPRGSILLFILFMNVVILFISSLIINILMQDVIGDVGYWDTVYYTLCMILDAGMIEHIIVELGTGSVVLVLVCIFTIILGSITFTGAVIGYVTNVISGFIDSVKADSRRIRVSGHTVILNWNSRASEIINDMLYLGTKETIIVLVNSDADRVKKEINERFYLTLHGNKALKNRLTVLVREGSTFSSKQLHDISLLYAKTVIILGEDDTNSVCRYETAECQQNGRGNANTIKTLVQVSEITSSDKSADDQRIIVEADDSWTLGVINRIIHHKERLGKCNIVPISVGRVLGQMLSQFCIFPELNKVYSELFSNKGAEFFSVPAEQVEGDTEEEKVENLLSQNLRVVPLATLDTKTGEELFFMADSEKDIRETGTLTNLSVPDIRLNRKFWLKKRNIIILGHNSKIREIMNGFESFRGEWNREDGSEILNIMVLDDKKSLEKHGYYKEYSYVNEVIEAEIYDTDLIKNSINRFIDSNEEDTSILVLSDDLVPEKDVDSYALTNLIYVQDIIYERLQKDPDYDTDRIDVIVEILNPKNHDVVRNYNIDNIVISNRYISKMVTQVGEKIQLFEFYEDILTYDEADCEDYESKEIYVKPVDEFLMEIPPKLSAAALIRGIYEGSPRENRSLVLGVARPGGAIELFEGNQTERMVQLNPNDKLILYSKH